MQKLAIGLGLVIMAFGLPPFGVSHIMAQGKEIRLLDFSHKTLGTEALWIAFVEFLLCGNSLIKKLIGAIKELSHDGDEET